MQTCDADPTGSDCVGKLSIHMEAISKGRSSASMSWLPAASALLNMDTAHFLTERFSEEQNEQICGGNGSRDRMSQGTMKQASRTNSITWTFDNTRLTGGGHSRI